MSQPIEMAGRIDITVSQSIEIALGQKYLCYSRRRWLLGELYLCHTFNRDTLR